MIHINAGSDDELIASVDMWGSEINDPPPRRKRKEIRGKVKLQRKHTKKRKADNPPVSDSDIDTDSLYDMSDNEDLE